MTSLLKERASVDAIHDVPYTFVYSLLFEKREMINLHTVFSETAAKLYSIADSLKEVSIPIFFYQTFLFSSTTLYSMAAEMIDILSKWAAGFTGNYFLYLFELANNTSKDKVYQAFQNAKTAKLEQRAYARLNNPSAFLYIGTSTNIVQRFKEHLGYGPRVTYAMNMRIWAKGLDGAFGFQCFPFSPTTPHDILQVIEDGCWEQLRPMMGRQGKR